LGEIKQLIGVFPTLVGMNQDGHDAQGVRHSPRNERSRLRTGPAISRLSGHHDLYLD
jgi:hypothetical protein